MAQEDPKPMFHVAPIQGWVNDPNGPFMYQGKYHLFYQHLPEGCEWAFGLVWGHSVSSDLVTWQHLPHAIVPTVKTLDADGCFSGCATVDTDGTPVLLYTGVRLRTNPDGTPLPPPECDLNLPFIESQLFATPTCSSQDDPLLVAWTKEPVPFIGLPPPSMNLTGWRDPFIVERPCEANQHQWLVLMGAGIKEVGGATIVYRARQLRDASSWRYDGLLCVGDGETGAVWECPLLAELNPLPAAGVAIGSTAHSRLALGARRHSLTHVAGAGAPNTSSSSSANSTATTAAMGASAEASTADSFHHHQQQQQQQHAAADGLHDQLPLRSTMSSSGSADLGTSGFGRACSVPRGPLGLVNPGGPFPGFCSSSAPLGSWDERYTHFYSISPDACTNPTLYWLGRYSDGRFDLHAAKGPLRLDLGDVLYAPNVMRDDYGRVLLWGWLQERRTVGTYDYAGCMTVPRLLHLDHDRLHQSPAPELLALRQGEAWQCGHVQLSPESSLSLPGVVGPHRLDIEVVFVQGSASTVGVFLRSWHQGGEGGAAVLYNWDTGLLEVVFEALDPATMTFSLTAPLARRIGGPITHKPGAPLALRLLLDSSVLEIFTGTGEVLSTRVYRGSPPHDHADAGIEFVALDGEATLQRVAAYEMASIWADRTQQQAAAAAAAVAEEETVMQGLEGLDSLMAVAEDQQQQQQQQVLDKAASLGASPRSLGRRSSGLLSPAALASSLKDSAVLQQHPLLGGGAASSQVSNKLHQLLLSPRAGGGDSVTPFAAAAAAAGGGLEAPHAAELVPEEELTADIFGLEELEAF